MFDLEQSIADWRRQMLAAGIKTPVPLEELEVHLREDIEQQMTLGFSAQQAFEIAARRIGQAEALEDEFVNAGVPGHKLFKQIAFTLAGVPNRQLTTNMNTNLDFEPRWATYSKAGAFLFPAIFLWLLTVIFVLPKANEICYEAGMTVFGFEHAPTLFKVLATIGPLIIFLTDHWFVAGAAVALAFFLLERFSDQWSRYRRLAIGGGVFLVNAAVLLSLALMIVSILIAAPVMAHHVK